MAMDECELSGGSNCEEEEDSSTWWIIAVVAGVAAIVGLLAALYIVRGKKKTESVGIDEFEGGDSAEQDEELNGPHSPPAGDMGITTSGAHGGYTATDQAGATGRQGSCGGQSPSSQPNVVHVLEQGRI